jgi:3-hydroxyisobutyrate dehydrogenase
MHTVALIGTGTIGSGIARSLLKAGWRVRIWNRTPSKMEGLLSLGAAQAKSPVEAAAEADYIVTAVADDEASRMVWTGPNGLLTGQHRRSRFAIECSTISLLWMRRLNQHVADAGLRYIDCPVTGGSGGAHTGSLTLLVGADPSDLEQVRPILESFSSNIIHMGLPGAGTKVKLIGNMMTAVHLTALAESIALAEEVGLDMARFLEVLMMGAVASPIVKGFAQAMIGRRHDFVNFSVGLMHKDVTYGLQMAGDFDRTVPVAATAASIWHRAILVGLSSKNVSAVIEAAKAAHSR